MKIDKDTVVTVTARIHDAKGKLLDDGKTARAYLHGGYGNTLAGIESALQGKEAGFAADITLSPEQAFGLRDESLVTTIPKTQFPPGVKVGGQLEGHDEQGRQQVFTVVKIKGPMVHLDGNHPLAGESLRIALKVLEVRAASAEEVQHGHAHGAHGHHH
ncbi:MAG: peptidylprolyl isomerase [Hydrogenophaga sp.]|uniref:FKBP-type peptidyl-prolyl cis-trans isomerase n=1 Tax=Hydrogenophaga sp. TaxID=1904254 RepID=UPI001DAEA0AA|nr:peptidylprolyl isomerase [Hydrogenophaga sp.]MBX3611062.1 peptidylprolyl isomerase [Hydrogenophaga sp.]